MIYEISCLRRSALVIQFRFAAVRSCPDGFLSYEITKQLAADKAMAQEQLDKIKSDQYPPWQTEFYPKSSPVNKPNLTDAWSILDNRPAFSELITL